MAIEALWRASVEALKPRGLQKERSSYDLHSGQRAVSIFVN